MLTLCFVFVYEYLLSVENGDDGTLLVKMMSKNTPLPNIS